jgi:acetyltransferase-like isoleucine patch superfamily enzyme
VTDRDAALREQQKARMAFMPWLYFSAKPHVRAWAVPWQRELHAQLSSLEAVHIDPEAFIAPSAHIFAEPHREVEVGAFASIAAHAFVHGPVQLEREVSLNAHVSLDGASAGIRIGCGTRIASYAALYAFDHGMAPGAPIREQPVRSLGISIGQDVWIGTRAVITDGVRVGDHAVIGASAVVTRDVPAWAVVGGVPARVIRDRRTGS